ncbi:MAG: MMPL family transporter [Planctomycetota bacterium]
MATLSLVRPRIVLAAVLLVTLLLGAAGSGLRVDNTPESWLPRGGEGAGELERFRERFGDDSLILVFTADARPEDDAWRSAVDALSDELRRAEGVGSVLDWEAPLSPLAPHLLNAEKGYAALAVLPREDADLAERGRLVAGLTERLDGWQDRVGRWRLAGTDVITYDLDQGSQKSLGGLSPLVLLAMCLVFFLATRSLRAVGAMVVAVAVTAVWTLGAMAIAGRPMNLIVAVVPAILAVVTAAQATHLLSRFQGLDGGATEDGESDDTDRAPRVRRWRRAIDGTWRPCLLSALTTAAGFASVGTSEIPPVRDLGLFSAGGTLASFLLVFTLVPALLVRSSHVGARARGSAWWTRERARRVGRLLGRRARFLVAAAVLLIAAFGAGLPRLELESKILRFFPSEHRVPVNYADVEENLLALTPIDLVLEGQRREVLAEPSLDALARFVDDAIAAEPLLRQALVPSIPPPLLRAFASGDAPVPAPLESVAWASGSEFALRVTLLSRTASSNECDALIQRLRSRLPGAFPEAVEAVVTGSATQLIRGQVLLLRTQLRSFALALAVVTAVILLAFRSLRTVGVSLLPNLVPLALVLGGMGWAGIPLDTATVTVAGIALGLIVDDTIHVLHGLRSALGRGADTAEAVAETLFVVGRPVLVTSVAIALGFGAFVLAPFRPTHDFGLLIAASAVAAVACDLVLLPAALQLRRR